jgi:hypothetical protein
MRFGLEVGHHTSCLTHVVTERSLPSGIVHRSRPRLQSIRLRMQPRPFFQNAIIMSPFEGLGSSLDLFMLTRQGNARVIPFLLGGSIFASVPYTLVSVFPDEDEPNCRPPLSRYAFWMTARIGTPRTVFELLSSRHNILRSRQYSRAEFLMDSPVGRT